MSLSHNILQRREQGYAEESDITGTSALRALPSAVHGSPNQAWTPLHGFQLEEALTILGAGDIAGLKRFTRLVLTKLCIDVLHEPESKFSALKHDGLIKLLKTYVRVSFARVLVSIV